MLQNGYLLAKIGADTAENERNFGQNLPKIGNYPTATPQRRRRRRRPGRPDRALRHRRRTHRHGRDRLDARREGRSDRARRLVFLTEGGEGMVISVWSRKPFFFGAIVFRIVREICKFRQNHSLHKYRLVKKDNKVVRIVGVKISSWVLHGRVQKLWEKSSGPIKPTKKKSEEAKRVSRSSQK